MLGDSNFRNRVCCSGKSSQYNINLAGKFKLTFVWIFRQREEARSEPDSAAKAQFLEDERVALMLQVCCHCSSMVGC